jgi:hypothetical protein
MSSSKLNLDRESKYGVDIASVEGHEYELILDGRQRDVRSAFNGDIWRLTDVPRNRITGHEGFSKNAH